MQTQARTRRLFFALWPTDALRAEIDASTQNILAGRDARKIPAANFHVTLAFLGAVSESLLEPVKAAAQAAVGAPFEIRFDRIETWKRAQLLCLSAAPTPSALALLVDRLRSNLQGLQFEADHKDFKPHVTLARDWRDTRIDQPCGPFEWPAREFVLVESQTGPRGSQYRVLEHWPLQAAHE